MGSLISAGITAARTKLEVNSFATTWRRRPVVIRHHIRTVDAGKAVTQSGVTACTISAQHIAPLILTCQQPCGTRYRFARVPQRVMWKPAGTLSGAVCPLPQGTPWVFFIGLAAPGNSQPFQYKVNKNRWRVNNIRTKSTFLGKESTTSGEVGNSPQVRESTFSVWIGNC